MAGIARTRATGADGMLPELLAWSSSMDHDLHLVREDLIGSAAHVTMLSRAGIVPLEHTRVLRTALHGLYQEYCAGQLTLPSDEEDVHMAVEAELGKRVGLVAGFLHTARSRNDQIALDLRLHVRDQGASLTREVAALMEQLADEGAELVLVDGIKVVSDEGWALVVPDPTDPVTHVWAEGSDLASSEALVATYAERIARMLP